LEQNRFPLADVFCLTIHNGGLNIFPQSVQAKLCRGLMTLPRVGLGLPLFAGVQPLRDGGVGADNQTLRDVACQTPAHRKEQKRAVFSRYGLTGNPVPQTSH